MSIFWSSARGCAGLAFVLLWSLVGYSAPAEQIYVWQRHWSPAVATALEAHGREFAQLDVLAAELNGFSGKSNEPAIDWKALQATGRPIGLVVRVGDYRGPTGSSAPATRRLVSVCQAAMAHARAAQLQLTELQIDYDCASSRLEAYLDWVRTIRAEVAPPKLVITILPDWLRQAAFPRLAAAVDSTVLQVHAVEAPRANRPATLCDCVQALRWIGQAERLGLPFRVALPDYGYRLGFDPAQRLIGVQAEGADRPWPADTTVSTLMADPAAIAQLVAELRQNPPDHLTAISWFRLPLAADDLTWPWITFEAVRQGITPSGQLRLELIRAPDGAVDLYVANQGTGACDPAPLVTRPGPNDVLAWDLLAGWSASPQPGGRLSVAPQRSGPLAPPRLEPGEKRRIGWLRYASSTSS